MVVEQQRTRECPNPPAGELQWHGLVGEVVALLSNERGDERALPASGLAADEDGTPVAPHPAPNKRPDHEEWQILGASARCGASGAMGATDQSSRWSHSTRSRDPFMFLKADRWRERASIRRPQGKEFGEGIHTVVST